MIIFNEGMLLLGTNHFLIYLYKHFFENGIVYVHHLLFDKDNSNSLTIISNKMIIKTNFLIWAGLRHSVPSHLKTNSKTPTEFLFTLLIDNKEFDVLNKKWRNYYKIINKGLKSPVS